MSGRARALTVGVLGLTVAVAVASVPLSAGREPVVDTVMYPLNAVVLGVAGLLIGLRWPRQRIGVLLRGLGLLAAAVELAEGYGYHDTWAGAIPAQWWASWASLIGAGSTATLIALFPDGHAAGRRWRWLPPTCVAATAAMALAAAFTHVNDDSYTFTHGANPYALDGLDGFATVAEWGFALSLLSAIASLATRFRRARGEERQQVKLIFWFACVLAAVGPPAAFVFNDSPVLQWAIALVVPLLPVTISVAILRYRLYDVDRLISRTVAWAALTVLVAAAWVSTALALGGLAGRGSAWVSAGATAAAAAVFLPLRRRVQDAVDRTFRPRRHHTLARMDTYLEDLRAGRVATDDLQGLLREVLHDPGLELHLLQPGQAPPAPRPDAGPGRQRTLVQRSGVPLAEVRHDVPPEAPLADVLSRAGLAIEIARLQAEVRRQLAEVEASRARIVAATHEERRRLERDLHDGAQQRLVSAGLALRHVQHQLADRPDAAADIGAVVTELARAIDDLRSLAAGVRPARLDDGLAIALRELAGRSPLPVRVEAEPGSLPDTVAATAYYVAAEALTNVVKHAAATRVDLRAGREDGVLVLTVRDDGVGGADPGAGTGLRGLADRVAAVGGGWRLESPTGSGTTLTVRLPCTS